ncbi:MAG: peptidase M17 [Planctomycetes bacterium SCN 63-9]|nr:MAG: peptidase M17 [Planctomycetes bacterium SCN 63-9]
MNIRLTASPLDQVSASWLVVGLFEGQDRLPDQVQGTPLAEVLTKEIDRKEITGSANELTPILGLSGFAAGSLLVVGLGKREKLDAGVSFSAGYTLAKRLSGKARDSVAIALPEVDEARLPAIISALVEGVIAGTRGPGLRKSEPNRHEFGELTLVAGSEPSGAVRQEIERAIRRGEIVGRAVNLARDLVNTPPAEKAPARLAERIREIADGAGVQATVWDEARLRDERFGGLLGVAAGSDQPPAFVILEYRAARKEAPTLALVGKGVTFDSGGLSLKPSASMEDMKSDMTGAAVVVAVVEAAARLALPVNLVGYLAITENMTGGRAMKLGDVLTMRNGKTVEVLNTDAEGRLILADALSYAVENEPARILDLATLTGACIVALGLRIAGLFGNDDAFCEDVQAACVETGERAWRLPLDDDFKESLKSTVADLKNVGGRWGGAVTAAKFLEQFVGAVPWVHLDIAGPSWSDSDGSSRDAGGTGCFVRTLVTYLETAAKVEAASAGTSTV